MTRYSASEIESMRESLRWLRTPWNQTFDPNDLNAQIERELVTHLSNGTPADELREEALKFVKGVQAATVRR